MVYTHVGDAQVRGGNDTRPLRVKGGQCEAFFSMRNALTEDRKGLMFSQKTGDGDILG